MADFSDLPDDISFISHDLQAKGEKRQREAALTIVRELIQRNPKKTGRSAGNWQVGMGRPKLIVEQPSITKVTGNTDPEALTTSQQAFVRKQLSKAIGEITKGKLSGADPTIFVSNTVPYVVPLNTTRPSIQAAPGWVEASIRFAANNTQGVS